MHARIVMGNNVAHNLKVLNAFYTVIFRPLSLKVAV